MAPHAQSSDDSVSYQSAGFANTGNMADRFGEYTNTALANVSHASNRVAKTGQGYLDRVLPPSQRQDVVEKVQNYALANPRLAAFLAMNLVFTGIPLLLFVLFSIGVLLFSVTTALVIALLAAASFTIFSVGLALLVLLPTIFFTTSAACFLFLMGLSAYYVLAWANGRKALKAERNGNETKVKIEGKTKSDE